MGKDPVHCNDDGKWYFYDEHWSNELGPYKTEKECRKACKDYGDNL